MFKRSSIDSCLKKVQGVPPHELPHDRESHLAVAVDDVQPSNVHHCQTHHLNNTVSAERSREKKTRYSRTSTGKAA